jgi:hypothetical protein
VPPNVGAISPAGHRRHAQGVVLLFAFDVAAALYATWFCASIIWRFVDGGSRRKTAIAEGLAQRIAAGRSRREGFGAPLCLPRPKKKAANYLTWDSNLIFLEAIY